MRHFGESLLPVSSVQYNIGGIISLLLARISIWYKCIPDHNKHKSLGNLSKSSIRL